MKLTVVVLLSLLAAANADQFQSYSFPNQGSGISTGGQGSFISTSQGTGGSFTSSGGSYTSSNQGPRGSFPSSGQGSGGSFVSSGHGSGGSFTSSGGGYTSSGQGIGTTSCGDGQVLHVDGRCVTPQIIRTVYVYDVPHQPQRPGPRPNIPLPKIQHNVLFVRLPENAGAQDPIVVPPPQQKNIIYILSKGTIADGQRVINVPAPAKGQPEVYFVNYGQGQNPTLPGGIDLQTALNSAVHQGVGQVIGSNTGISGTSTGSGYTGGISDSSIQSGSNHQGLVDVRSSFVSNSGGYVAP